MTESLDEIEFVRTTDELCQIDLFNLVKVSTGTIANFIRTSISCYLISSFKNQKNENKYRDIKFNESSKEYNQPKKSYMWLKVKLWKDSLKNFFNNFNPTIVKNKYNYYLNNHIKPLFNTYELISDKYTCVNNLDLKKLSKDEIVIYNPIELPIKHLNDNEEVINSQSSTDGSEDEDTEEPVKNIESKQPENISKKRNQGNLKCVRFSTYRFFTTSEVEGVDNYDDTQEQDYQEVEDEFMEYCRNIKEFLVLDRMSETGNMNSFLSRLPNKNPDEFLEKYKSADLNNLNELERYSDSLYAFVSCGFHVNHDDIKHIFHELYNYYAEGLKKENGKEDNMDNQRKEDNRDDEEKVYNINTKRGEKDQLERLSKVFGSVLLSYCESGVFKDDMKKVGEVLEMFLFGDMRNRFLKISSGKLINSVLFLYSVSQFFEKDYDIAMEGVYNDIIESISKKELSMDMSDLYYLKLSTKFISNQNPSLVKKLSKESISFLSNVVYQDYIRDKELHGLEDSVPLKIKDIDSSVEGGVFNIGPFTFTHVSLSNKNVYLLNKPYYYFNSNLKLGRREYLNWMDSFLKSTGWNIIHL